jgi:outer membrane protein assembly factor BamB
MNNSGVLACGDIATGERLWQLRVGGQHWSTPVVAGDRMYCINSEGAAKVVQLGDEGTVVSENKFGEEIKGSAAISDGALYVRSDRFLWKIARGS